MEKVAAETPWTADLGATRLAGPYKRPVCGVARAKDQSGRPALDGADLTAEARLKKLSLRHSGIGRLPCDAVTRQGGATKVAHRSLLRLACDRVANVSTEPMN